ncbi:MAG: hypothetical protein SX243_08290 [Acidobacteriota bacterium]|nr:hypothetical protein [Acidobacteriota bacterium]
MKDRFGRIVLILSVLGTLGLVWVGIDGYRVGDTRPELQRHLAQSMAVILALFFGHSWIALYLTFLSKTLRRGAEAGGLTEAPWSWRSHRPVTWAVATSLILLLVLFLLGPAAMLEMAPPWTHAVAFFAALAAQILALVLETRSLRLADGQLAELNDRLD